ncbi:UNVERIFIED_CONTAM: hypothetical protein FKN15_020026 [Acipenser sinensis]
MVSDYGTMDRNALAELLQALESRRDAEERRREERYTALIERWGTVQNPGRHRHHHHAHSAWTVTIRGEAPGLAHRHRGRVHFGVQQLTSTTARLPTHVPVQQLWAEAMEDIHRRSMEGLDCKQRHIVGRLLGEFEACFALNSKDRQPLGGSHSALSEERWKPPVLCREE